MLTDLRPILWTTELQETIQFYVDTLGFTCDEYNEDWGWASLGKDNAGLMLAKPNEHTPFTKPLFTGTFYFNADDVEKLWNELKDKTKIVYPIETFEWGMREFAIYDNNGYTLQFGQEVNSISR